MNVNENYENQNAPYKDYRNQYSKANKMGIKTYSFANSKAYNELSEAEFHWFRNPYRVARDYGVNVDYSYFGYGFDPV